MVAPIKYLSGRQQQQKLGIEGDSENKKVLEVVGQVGIGTTIFDTDSQLDVRGDINFDGDLTISGTISQANVNGLTTTSTFNSSGLSTFQDNIRLSSGKTLAISDQTISNNYDIDIVSETPSIRLASTDVNNNAEILFREEHTDDTLGAYIRHNASETDGNKLVLGVENSDVEKDAISIFRDNYNVSLSHDGTEKLKTLGAGVTVYGQVESQSLKVTGISTLTTLGVGGLSTFSDSVTVGNATTGVGISTDGNLSVTGLTTTLNLKVVGVSTLDSLGVTGLTTSLNLKVVGVSTLDSLGVTGLTTSGALEVSGISTFNDNITLGRSTSVTISGPESIIIDPSPEGIIGVFNVSQSASGDLVSGSTAITGIVTDGIVVGQDVKEIYDIISAGTTVTGIGNSIVNIFPVGAGDATGQVFEFGLLPTSSGALYVKGDLYVEGSQFQVDSTTVNIADKVIGIATTCTDNNLLDGAGLGIGTDGNRKTILYHNNSTSLKSSENFNIASGKVYQIDQTERLSADTLSLGTGTTIHSPASNELSLGTNNSDRLRIDSDGNVGIGTDDPLQSLHVGLANLFNSRVSAAGTVGLGTDTITGINTAGISTGFTVQSTNAGILRENTLVVSLGDSTVGLGTTTLLAATSETFNFGLFDDNSNTTVVTSGGNVGIGTTNPTSKLDLDGTLHVSGISTFGSAVEFEAVDIDDGLTANTAIIEDLTNDKVVIAGTGGELETNDNLSFDDTSFTVGTATTGVVARTDGTLNVSGLSTFSSNLTVGTATTGVVARTDGTLNVSGVATFKDNAIFDSTDSIQLPVGSTEQRGFSLVQTGIGTIGIGSDIITGINTEGIVVGQYVLGPTGVLRPNTLVDSVNEGTVGLGTTSLSGIDTGTFRFGTVAVVPGQIRFNDELSSFEGYSDSGQWISLGAAKDVDGDTFIRAENAPGDDDDKLVFFTAGSERVAIDADGKVGIGTTNPTEDLDVNGSVLVSETTTSAEFVGGGSDLRNLSGTHLVSYASAANISHSALSIAGVSTYNEVGILTGTYLTGGDTLGFSIDCTPDGRTIVSGAVSDEIGAVNNTGVVYVYDRSGNSFNVVGVLTGTHATGNDYFGASVAISNDGKTIVVGADDDEHPDSQGNSGVAYVFDRVGDTFTEVGILTGTYASHGSDSFGESVAISGDGRTIVVGAEYDHYPGANSGSGVAYVFDRVGNNFNQVGILTGSSAQNTGDNFGNVVAIDDSGKVIVVGAHFADNPASADGTAYVFERVNNTFNEVGILTGSGAVRGLGSSLDISADGSTIAVGAYDASNSGAINDSFVYIFDRNPDGTYSETAKLDGSYASGNSTFGRSLAISADGNTLAISDDWDSYPGTSNAAGLVYVYKRQGDTFNEVAYLQGTYAVDFNDNFGFSVAVSADGKHIFVGADLDEVTGVTGGGSGVVYAFDEVRETYVYSGPTGNIGIGTTNPESKLDVNGTLNVSGVSTFSDNLTVGTATTGVIARTDGTLSVSGASTISTLGVTGLTTSLNLKVSGLSTFVNGEVLIGRESLTGTSNQRLQIDGGGYFSGAIGIGETNPAGAIVFDVDVAAEGTLAAPISGVSTDIITGINTTGITTGLTVKPIANVISVGTTVVSIGNSTVGLGTTALNTGITTTLFSFGEYEAVSAQTKLHVTGDQYVSGNITASGDLTARRIYSNVFGEFRGQVVQATETEFESQRVSGISTINSLNITSISVGNTITSELDVDSPSDFSEKVVIGVNTTDTALEITQDDVNGYALNVESSLYVLADGKVGIGITNPQTKIQVVGISSLDNLKVTGISTFHNKVHLLDNQVLHFGGAAGENGDLQISHDTNNSIIKDGGEGSLKILGSVVEIKNVDDTKLNLKATADQGVSLYYNNNTKLDTNADGINVSGKVGINSTTLVGVATTSTATTITVGIHSELPISDYRSVEYTIQVTRDRGTDIDYHLTKILALHDGTNTFYTEYGTVYNNQTVANYNVDISGGNLRLTARTAGLSSTANYVVNFVATKV